MSLRGAAIAPSFLQTSFKTVDNVSCVVFNFCTVTVIFYNALFCVRGVTRVLYVNVFVVLQLYFNR